MPGHIMSKAGVLGRMSGIGRAMRHRNYRLFFAGQLVSLTGTWMQTAALSWLVYRLSGSAELLGLVAFASYGPIFILAQVGGAVADRVDRRRILVATQIVSMALAFTLAVLTLSHLAQVWEIFALSAMLGMVNAFDIPARQSFVVEMVGREDLANAIALNSTMFNAARLLGPAVAGLLVAQVGEGWCFMLNAASYIAVIWGLLAMRLPPFTPREHKTAILDQMRQGLAFAFARGPIRAVLILIGLMGLLGVPYTVLMPIFANRILGGGPQHLGMLMSAAGLGAMLGAVFLASRTSLAGMGRLIYRSVLIFGMALISFAYSRWFWASALLLVLVGFCQMTNMASSNTLIQAMVPDAFRGRIMAIYAMMFMGMAPMGALLAGFLADHLGAPATVACGGLATIVGGTWFAWMLPSLREEAKRLVAAKGQGRG